MNTTSIQETFFSAALQKHEHVIVYLLSGLKITGKVRSYDKYSVVLEENDQEQLVFKHSISAAFLCRNKECQECAAS